MITSRVMGVFASFSNMTRLFRNNFKRSLNEPPEGIAQTEVNSLGSADAHREVGIVDRTSTRQLVDWITMCPA